MFMIYAYIRVSTKYQNIDRQYEEIKALNIEDKLIYIDKESGKDFDRTNYQKLIKKIKKDDLLIIKSIDRLGRNYQMILEEWARITKIIGADIKVLDMPLLDTRIEGKNLVGKFISDIVLQVLSFVAENERINIKQRQAEGIKIAKEKGVKFGRPKIILPPNTNKILDKYINKELTNIEAAKLIKISRGTFFRLVKERKKERKTMNSNR
ncbi:MAG: recombinase family protein [Roseburia sp.]|nr:recombinase family protein [Roseburia sp.]